jgi:4'-phosphopantetheinyl transferase
LRTSRRFEQPALALVEESTLNYSRTDGRIERMSAKVKLNRDEVHVWSASLELGSESLGELERTLSADELQRAARFHFERDRKNFVGRRGILRNILATYLGTKPSALRLAYNDFGKPCLEGSREARSLSFNPSRSGVLMLVGVALDRPVGIDIEYIDSSVSSNEVAKRFFSMNEIAILEALPQSLRLREFFNFWARKEAYIKARGMGLSIPLDSFDVSPIQGEAAVVLGTGDSSDGSNWKIENLNIDSRYAAAVAAAGRGWKVTRSSWQSGVSAPG